MSFSIVVIVAGKKGGHKGRVRTYTSPEEIDAQMKAEKERKKVGAVRRQKLFNRVPHGARCVQDFYQSTAQASKMLEPTFPIMHLSRTFTLERVK